MEAQTFYRKMLGPARLACRLLDVSESNVPVVLAQWDVESGRESASWCGGNNYAGISPGGTLAAYPTVEDFVREYARTLHNGYYDDVLRLMRDARPPEVVALALARSPWAESRYSSGYYDTFEVPAPDKVTGDILRSRLEPYVSLWHTEASPEDWKASGKLWATENGISDGTRPDDPATRAEVWEMLRRYDGQKGATQE